MKRKAWSRSKPVLLKHPKKPNFFLIVLSNSLLHPRETDKSWSQSQPRNNLRQAEHLDLQTVESLDRLAILLCSAYRQCHGLSRQESLEVV